MSGRKNRPDSDEDFVLGLALGMGFDTYQSEMDYEEYDHDDYDYEEGFEGLSGC